MSKFVVRHGHSTANDGKQLSFLRHDAKLTRVGEPQAYALGKNLREDMSVDPSTTPVACSELVRAQETAAAAGFVYISINPLLNEVLSGMSPEEFDAARTGRIVPRPAIRAAEQILGNPPHEQIWITSALVMVGLAEVLGITNQYKDGFIPKFCDIRIYPI